MTYGEAVQNPDTKLGAAAKQSADDRRARIARATEIAERDGITLEAALVRIWEEAIAA